MIAILNYGSGNINAISNIYKTLKIPFCIASKPRDLNNAEKIILPGVGSFDYCMNKLNTSGLKDVLNRKVLEEKIPVLGICIGLHLMADSSSEGKLDGLGWIEGKVKKIDDSKLMHKPMLPHMGWNSIQIKKSEKLFEEINPDKGFYFIHSYYIDVYDKTNIMTTTSYGDEFVTGINKSNIYAVQFHPEKSHSNGMKLLQNFSQI